MENVLRGAGERQHRLALVHGAEAARAVGPGVGARAGDGPQLDDAAAAPSLRPRRCRAARRRGHGVAPQECAGRLRRRCHERLLARPGTPTRGARLAAAVGCWRRQALADAAAFTTEPRQCHEDRGCQAVSEMWRLGVAVRGRRGGGRREAVVCGSEHRAGLLDLGDLAVKAHQMLLLLVPQTQRRAGVVELVGRPEVHGEPLFRAQRVPRRHAAAVPSVCLGGELAGLPRGRHGAAGSCLRAVQRSGRMCGHSRRGCAADTS
mmetsp:Transcript_23303/g.65209  ORF Transcript_23303/g.65209 Transcript_23303/m.65209 type:complete len:263 (-) Transcript_23303:84-872(-)